MTSWLTYWVTFAALTLFEGARLWSSSRNRGASIKLMSWLPFYYVMRPRIPSENEAFGEEFGSKSCFFDAFPFSEEFRPVFRLALIVWLFLPATRGAQGLYSWAVAPLLRRYRVQVDDTLSRPSHSKIDRSTHRNRISIYISIYIHRYYAHI